MIIMLRAKVLTGEGKKEPCENELELWALVWIRDVRNMHVHMIRKLFPASCAKRAQPTKDFP